MIYIVGLGPGDAGSVTPHALEAMRNCGRVLLRTEALTQADIWARRALSTKRWTACTRARATLTACAPRLPGG